VVKETGKIEIIHLEQILLQKISKSEEHMRLVFSLLAISCCFRRTI